MNRVLFKSLVCLSLVWQTGHALELTEQQARKKPVLRYGSLPFPSVMYTTAADDLGEHSYEGRNSKTGLGPASLFALNVGDVDRGIAYTCRLGFIDVAHVRIAIDFTAYFHAQIKTAMLAGRDSIELQGLEPSVYTVTFRYPARWQDLPETELQREIDTVALLGGRYLTHISMTWHEILTWYGWTSGPVPNAEKSSAFTYEDIVSHVLGTEIAARAIRHPDLSFNDAVTLELNRDLDLEEGRLMRLGARQSKKLGKARKGEWYRVVVPHFVYDVRRSTAIGFEQQELEGWRVPDADGCEDATPVTVRVPGMTEFDDGGIYAGLLDVEIEPRVNRQDRLLDGLTEDQTVNVRRDLKQVMEILERRIVDEAGEKGMAAKR